MSATVEISIGAPNAGTVAAQFAAIPAQAEAAMRAVVLATALRIEGRAKRSIQRGPKSGRVYGKHRASAPGQAPATDTGRLVSSIHHTMMGSLQAEVFSNVHYAGYLELGTSKMAPRPYLKPALDAEAPAFLRDIELAALGAFG